MKVAIILNAPELKEDVKEDYVVFADGAYKFKDKLKNKTVLGVVGDFDTLDHIPEEEKIVKLTSEKDFTDGERAVYYAKESGADEIAIYGATGGKPDHVLGNLTLLSVAESLGLKAEIAGGNCVIRLVSGLVEEQSEIGRTVSLIPFGGEATVKYLYGLYYPFDKSSPLVLKCGNTLGLSNRATEKEFAFDVIKGEVLMIKYL